MAAKAQGSITAIYTVLVEGDDHVGDPVGDTARSVLDGHIVLSRALAEAALYPADRHRRFALTADAGPGRAGALQACLALPRRSGRGGQEKQDIIDLGAYVAGRDPLLDEAMRRGPAMEAVLRQGAEAVPLAKAIDALAAALPEVVP